MTEKELRLLAILGFGTGVALAALYSQQQTIKQLKVDLSSEKAVKDYYRRVLFRTVKDLTPEQLQKALAENTIDIKFLNLINIFRQK